MTLKVERRASSNLPVMVVLGTACAGHDTERRGMTPKAERRASSNLPVMVVPGTASHVLANA